MSSSLQHIFAKHFQRWQCSFVEFACDAHVPIGGKIVRFGDVWTKEQKRFCESIDASLQAVMRGDVPPIPRCWLEATKGFGKDLLCCLAILYLLSFSPRSIRIQVGAYDAAQASEPKLIAKQIVNADAPLNRLVASKISVQKDRIVAHENTPGRTESVCEILTTDAYGSHGARPDVVIANELTHVLSEAFMQTLLDNLAKVSCGFGLIVTNAGNTGTFQSRWRDDAIESDRWHVEIWNYPAPWITEPVLREAEKRNPRERYLRLFFGVWSTGGGDCIDAAKIAACTTLSGPHTSRRDRMIYLAGLDLGIKRDHSALVIVAADVDKQIVELASVQSWAPNEFESGEVDLSMVQAAVVEAKLRYNVAAFLYDPYQCQLLAQQLQQQGIVMIEFPFTSQSKDVMAKALLEAFNNGLVRLYKDDEFARDLLRLRIKDNSFGGLRLDAVRDANGHADKATAFSIVLPHSLVIAQSEIGLSSDYDSDIAEQLVPTI